MKLWIVYSKRNILCDGKLALEIKLYPRNFKKKTQITLVLHKKDLIKSTTSVLRTSLDWIVCL